MKTPWSPALVAMVLMSGVHASPALPAWARDFAPSDIDAFNDLGVNLTDVEKDLKDYKNNLRLQGLKDEVDDGGKGAVRTTAERLKNNITSAARRFMDPAAFMTTVSREREHVNDDGC
ncbi:uncharacterized protein LOC127749895 isoform X2 [Frankliniella occidentalis]|nr:uncharacterized protein LOC127749895 isoform X2 [Frankliniella occidentalis]XP_052125846.1 uncharacterized protein LOC127749895 isoform X2 [Frankliniella occidentalis]